MNWIEIITIRLSKQENTPRVLDIIRDIKAAQNGPSKNSVSINLYQNKGIESDWTIHLGKNSPGEQAEKSQLGQVIIETFRPFGLVNHSIWERR